MATEKEVQQAGERVAKLRQQIADEQSKRATIASDSAEDTTLAALRAEEERLKRQLEQEKELTAHEKAAGARAAERAGYVDTPPSESAPAMNPTPDGAPTFSPEQVKMLKDTEGTSVKEVTAELTAAAEKEK